MRDSGGGGGGFPPGLPKAGEQIEVDRGVLRDVAKKLQADLEGHEGYGDGSLNDFQSGGSELTAAELGHYPAGEDIASSTFRNAHNQIGSTYSTFLTTYQQVIQAIERSAENYQGAEDAGAATANSVDSGGGQW